MDDRKCNVKFTITPKQKDILDSICKSAKKDGGRKISRSEVICGAVRLMQELDVDFTGIRSEEELLSRLRDATERFRKD